MSIRIKLIIIYIVCTLFSAGIIVVSLFAGVGNYMRQVTDAIIENSEIDEAIIEVIDLIADLKQAEEYNPEKLINSAYMEEINDRLQFFNSSLIVLHKDTYYKYINIEDQVLRDNLIPYDSRINNDSRFDDDSKIDDDSRFDDFEFARDNYDLKQREYSRMDVGNKRYNYIEYTFDINDEEVVYFILTEITTIKNLHESIRAVVSIVILILVFITTLPIVIVIQKRIIRPMKELEKGAKEIGEGNLEFELKAKSNDEIGRVVKSYEKMRMELKKSIEKQVAYENNRKELISSISHDLKTPMTSIKGYVEGILDGVANTKEKQEQYLKVIHQKSLDMDRMIDDLFTFSKLDLQKLPYEFVNINMETFIREYSEEAMLEYEKVAKIGFEIRSNSTSEPIVSIDRLQIRRVLQNMIQNSLKYNESEIKKIDLIIINNIDHIELTVKDNGIGMNEEEVKHAFQIFYRSDASRNTKTGGSGLGLAIVKQIIDGHNGSISIQSSKTSGTAITIKLAKEIISEWG